MRCAECNTILDSDNIGSDSLCSDHSLQNHYHKQVFGANKFNRLDYKNFSSSEMYGFNIYEVKDCSK